MNVSPNPIVQTARDPDAALLVKALGERCVVLVGIMGAGKTTMGRRLGARLGLPFVDADAEIELAAGMSIPEIFDKHGETFFRDGERRVVSRLLGGGPKIVATGGGAFMNAATRERIAQSGLSVWLKPELDVLMRRVRKRSNRPLLNTADPEAAMRAFMEERYPTYSLADVTVESRDGPHEWVLEDILGAVARKLELPVFLRPASVVHAQAGEPAKIRVELGARSYDILIGPGLIAAAGARIAELAPGSACAIVTDGNVAAAHLASLEASLSAAGVRHSAILVPAGEATKSFHHYAQVCDALIAAKAERNDIVIALGGGVVGDLAGFAAASVRRGMRFVQVPTSLLAQVDSSVGGKTGINSVHGKNLVGAFHQPSLVLADTGALDTLPEREFRAGYAEIVKYGLIGDRAFFEWLEANRRGIFAGGPARVEAIARSCAAKAAVVARDETETGERALLNLGHTFGHAFERLSGYDGARIVHGEGVAIGMACAFRFSVRLGLCNGQEAGRVEAHLQASGLPVRMAAIPGFDASPDEILEAMAQDKKVKRGKLTFILARAIGDSFIKHDVDPAAVRDFLAADMAPAEMAGA